jgi:3-methyladenine DNA glycosylase AlkC
MLLKEVYDDYFLIALAKTLSVFDKKFDQKNFLKNLQNQDWADKALKQRMRAITLAINQALSPQKYHQKIAVLKEVVHQIAKDKNSNLALIIFPDFVEVFGLDDFEISMATLEFFTEFGSSEFAVRQFIKLDEKNALSFFAKWSKSDNHHVRRLASEGCRPRLPWGEALQNFKKNPSAILPILENLKYDESAYVRKSIANNLNDISKDHPQIVLDLLKKWQQEKVDSGLIKHALRGLLKKGDEIALRIIGVEKQNLSKNFTIQSFALQKAEIRISQNLIFNFVLENQRLNTKIRLEYAVYFLKKNGSLTKKIFQITTKNFAKGLFSFVKKHSFRDLSTRKHYAGKHLISLVINGVELQQFQFDLI